MRSTSSNTALIPSTTSFLALDSPSVPASSRRDELAPIVNRSARFEDSGAASPGNLLSPGLTVLDLGAYPESWLAKGTSHDIATCHHPLRNLLTDAKQLNPMAVARS